MKKKLKVSKKSYETVFSFKINGTMDDLIIPTPPPGFPPVTPPPETGDPGYPGYPGYPGNPFPPIPPVGNYPGLRPWRQLSYVYIRDYSVHPAGSQYDWIDGQPGIDWFEWWKQNHGYWAIDPDTGALLYPCTFSFTIPGDRKVEETVLGMYPTDGSIPFPTLVNKYAIIAAFHYYCFELIATGETGVAEQYVPPGAVIVSRSETFQLVFSGDIVYA
jgi:hypothetical protein